MSLRSFLILIGLWVSMAATAIAAEKASKYHDVETLRETIEEHLKADLLTRHPHLEYGKDLFIEIGHLDSRLQLALCDDSLTMKINRPPHSSSRVTVKTSCQYGGRWTIYVPATVEIFEEVVVTSRDMRRGTILSESDLSTMRLNTSKFRIGIVSAQKQLIGMELTRPLRSGSPINLSYVKKPNIVARGDMVVLEAKSATLKVAVAGTALDTGHLGKKIKVRNNQSNRVVDAMVVGPGKVRVAAY